MPDFDDAPDWRDYLSVFPVLLWLEKGEAKKHPMVKWRTESAPWEEWTGRWPRATKPGTSVGWGIDCAKNGLVVIDEDEPDAVEHWLGAVPLTYTVRTHKGRHFYFLAPTDGEPIRNSVRKVAPGVDVRAEGGFVVAAGSLHPTGVRYTVERGGRPVPLPEDVRTLLERAAQGGGGGGGTVRQLASVAVALDGRAERGRYVLPDDITEGGRGEHLFRYACSLEAHGLDTDEAVPLLHAAWARCTPPYTERTPEAMWAHVVAEYRRGDGGGAAGGVGDGDGEAEESADPTWAQADLADHLRQGLKRPEPTLMPREDGVHLLYPGLVHSIHGESESGKSWVVQAEAARLLRAGQRVLYIDLESDVVSVLDRLVTDLGVPAEAVVAGLDYRSPESRPTPQTWGSLLEGSYALAVVDGVTEAMGWLRGGVSNDNDDIARWMKAFPKALARATGAAVVLIDHVTKSRDGRGRFAIGGQHKMAGLTGASYTLDVAEVFGRGRTGRATLWIGKDRPGSVRPHGGAVTGQERLQPIADFVLRSDDQGRVEAGLRTPAERPTAEGKKVARVLMISLALQEAEDGLLTRKQLRAATRMRDTDLREAVTEMLADGDLEEVSMRKDGDHQKLTYLRLTEAEESL